MNGDPCQGCVGKDSSSCNDTVDSYEGELVVRYEIPSVYVIFSNPQGACELSSILRPVLQVRKLEHRRIK